MCVYSCTYAVVIAFLVIVMILFSFMNKGNVNILMGFFGLGTCAMAVIGIWLGIKGFREREKIYTPCKVGITVNAVFLVAMVAFFVWGALQRLYLEDGRVRAYAVRTENRTSGWQIPEA